MLPQINIVFLKPYAVLMLALGIPLCFILASKAYHKTLPPVSRSIRFLLTGLRFISLLLILFILCQPILRFCFVRTQSPLVLMLWDNSSSMLTQETDRSRADRLNELFDSDTLKQFLSRYRVLSYRFDDHLDSNRISSTSEMLFNGSGTNFSRVLETLQTMDGEDPIDAAILFTDGRNTEGSRVFPTAQSLNFPIHILVVGDASEKSDIILDDLIARSVAYVDSPLPLEAVIRTSDLEGRRIPVELRSDEGLLETRFVELPAGSHEVRVQFELTPKKTGFRKFTVHIPAEMDELTTENNTREKVIHILKQKMSVVLLAGAPHPDVGFLRRQLEHDEDISISVRTVKRGGGFYENPELSSSTLLNADLFILYDFPSPESSPDQWRNVKSILLNSNKPCLVIAGGQIDTERIQELGDRLPFSALRSVSEREVLPELTNAGLRHPILQMSENQRTRTETISQLPALYSRWKEATIPEDAICLITARSDTDTPIVLSREVRGGGKCVAVLGSGLYRWDLLMLGFDAGNETVTEFLKNTLRWLSLSEIDKAVRVTTNARIYRAGETVRITVEVLDGLKQPVDFAVLDGRLIFGDQSTSLHFKSFGNGKYHTTLNRFEKGSYQIQVSAGFDNQILGHDTTAFSISRFNPEFLNTKADPGLMTALAQTTGGVAGPPDSLGAILRQINIPEQIKEDIHEFEPLTVAWMLFFILLLLCLEWLIRKRKGLV